MQKIRNPFRAKQSRWNSKVIRTGLFSVDKSPFNRSCYRTDFTGTHGTGEFLGYRIVLKCVK